MVVIDFDQLRGLTYIFGTNLDSPSSRNGSGKSTIIDGLVFALFGRTMKNTSNQYLPNRFVSKKLKTYAKVYFTVDGTQYTSECHYKGYIKTVAFKLQKFNNQTNQWEDITQSTVNKTRRYICQNILNCSFELFKSSIVITASDCLNFFEGMTKQQKRSYIQNIFNLDCFGVMFNMIKSDLRDLQRQVSYNNNQIIKHTSQLQQLRQKFDSYDKKLSEDVTVIKKQLVQKCNTVKKLQQQRTILQQQCAELQYNNQQYKKVIKDIKTINNGKHAIQKQIIKLQSQIKSIQKLIEQIGKIKQGLCNSCKQLMDQRYNFSQKINQIQQLNKDIDDRTLKLNKLDIALQNCQNNKCLLQEKNGSYTTLTNNITKIDLSLKHTLEDIKKLNSEYQNLSKKQSNPFTQLLNKTAEELQDLKVRNIQYQKNIKHLDILKQVCSQNGVKAHIIKDIIKLLNSLIQKYLNQIGADYLVYFDESFDFKFITMSGECQYTNFSAGQRQRIQIATIFAFRDLIMNGKTNANIFIIDEFLDSAIDGVCIKNVLQILYKKVVQQHQSIFIISHRQQTTQHHIFNNIIQVIKQGGISTLKVN